MPRNGSGVYSKVPGTAAVSGQTASSADYNSQIDDMVTDANNARPIVAGGTGATTAAGALTNLGLTATVAEINTLDGITATAAELNTLNGITADVGEINTLDGITATTAQLNQTNQITGLANGAPLIDTAGTASAFTLALPASLTNAAGQSFNIRFHLAPDAGATIAIDGQTAIPLRLYSDTGSLVDLVAGDVAQHSVVTIALVDIAGNLRAVIHRDRSTIQPYQLNTTGDAPVYAARAWVNFDGTGTVSIAGSGNVSSITDVGTGEYVVNFATAMEDANYAAIVTVGDASANSRGVSGANQYSTTSVGISANSGTNSAQNRELISVAIFR